MSDLEKVARLIYGAIASWQDGVMMDLEPWEEAVATGSAVVDLARETARAAVEALREPSEGMASRGAWVCACVECQGDSVGTMDAITAAATFTAMIDHILKEG